MTDKDYLLRAYCILDELKEVLKEPNLSDEDMKAISAVKDVLARHYIIQTQADCQYNDNHVSEFFNETLQADIIEYHRRADAWENRKSND